MKTALSIITLLVMSTLAHAGHPVRGRIVVRGKPDAVQLKGIEAPGGKMMNATWVRDEPEKANQYLAGRFEASKDWKQISLSFEPSKDGMVILELQGAWNSEGVQTWTLFDNITVSGTEIKNPNFEEGSANWILRFKDDDKASICEGGQSGAKSLRVSHDCSAKQLKVPVKANQKVTIKAWIRAGNERE